MSLAQFLSVKNAKRAFLNSLNGTKFENRENAEIPGNSVKSVLLDIQNGKTQLFFRMSTLHSYTYSVRCGFHIYSGVMKIRNLFMKIKNELF